MNEKNEDYDMHFFQLVFSLQAGAMQQMGKITSPLTGKLERDLEIAKASIDMLDMLQRKTEGNLTVEEKKLIDHTLYELRLNYVEEIKKGDSEPEKTGDTEKKAENDQEPPEKSPENDDGDSGRNDEK